MRHAPFAVTMTAREHWLRHFRVGLDAVDLTPEPAAERAADPATPKPAE
jgi:hemoglobin